MAVADKTDDKLSPDPSMTAAATAGGMKDAGSAAEKKTHDEGLDEKRSETIFQKASKHVKTGLENKEAGNMAFKERNFRLAIKFFTAALSCCDLPEDVKHLVYSNRSAAYSNMQRYEEALKDAEKIIELKKDFVKGYARKGLALFYLGRIVEARTAYNDGLDYDPDNDALRSGIRECTALLDSQLDAALSKRRSVTDYLYTMLNPLKLKFLHWVLYLVTMLTLISGILWLIHGDKIREGYNNRYNVKKNNATSASQAVEDSIIRQAASAGPDTKLPWTSSIAARSRRSGAKDLKFDEPANGGGGGKEAEDEVVEEEL